MDELLTPVSSRRSRPKSEPLLLMEEVKKSAETTQPRPPFKSTSPEEALESLKDEPDYDSLVAILRYLASHAHAFDVRSPSPLSARIVQVLVTSIVPNYWAILKEDSGAGATSKGKQEKTTDLGLLFQCLRSVAGLSATAARLRALISESKSDGAGHQEPRLHLVIILDLLRALLEGEDSVQKLSLATLAGVEQVSKRRPMTQELVSIIGSGRIISLAAEAEAIIAKGSKPVQSSWIADRKAYSSWLASSIVWWAQRASSPEEAGLCADLLKKSLQLGYPELVVGHLITDLLLRPTSGRAAFHGLMGQLPALEQKRFLFVALDVLSSTYLATIDGTVARDSASTISAVAGLVAEIVRDNTAAQGFLVSWLETGSNAFRGGIGIRRSVLAVLSEDRESLSSVLETAVNTFGGQLFIKHSPILQQEAQAQTLLLAAGYVHRLVPMKLVLLLRSSVYLRGISNRIGASQTRARFLGMAVGEALSNLTDKSGKKLDFHMDELDTAEGRWYKGLVTVSDTVGPYDSLRAEPKAVPNTATSKKMANERRKDSVSKAAPRPKVPPTTGFIIEEVDDDGEEDDDLVPYAKPDSDAEDSDDDATLVVRNKPKAPVYVRDLIVYLRDSENYDRQKLALETAPVLIRRKGNFGTEVKEHARELASLLIGIQDSYEMDDFYHLRLQGMVALVVAQPREMGPWFARTFFEGDYSLSQRASVLTVLGLSARELAGFETSEYAPAAAFPSKSLPEQVGRLFLDANAGNDRSTKPALKALPSSALDSIAKSLTADFLAPMAADAADAVTGPDVLKLSSFTSRVKEGQGAGSKKKGKPQVRKIANTTAQLVSESFFFPLTARFQGALHTASARTRGILFQPLLLSQYLKTLALLLHAAGPSTLALPAMTAEYWALLLGGAVQAHCAGDAAVTHAVLFGLLTLLDVNAAAMRDLCRDMGREMVQTQEWASQVFDNTRGGDGPGGLENDTKMLAAGVLIRLKEGIEKYSALLMGDMIG